MIKLWVKHLVYDSRYKNTLLIFVPSHGIQLSIPLDLKTSQSYRFTGSYDSEAGYSKT